MVLLRHNFDEETLQCIANIVREKFIDIVSDFDYSVFRYFKPEDQTTIKRINVDVKDKVLTLSRKMEFDFVHNTGGNAYHDSRVYYEKSKMIVDVKMKVISSKINSFIIYIGTSYNDNSRASFELYVGDEKYLINDNFYDKSDFEGYVFQQETLDKPSPFGLSYVLQMIQTLRI